MCILRRFKNVRSEQEAHLYQLKAFVQHVPVPLISLHSDGKVEFLNNNAKYSFSNHSVTNINDLKKLVIVSKKNLAIQPGEQRSVNFSIDDMEQQLAITATHISIQGKQDILVSTQNIQNELDQAQLQA